MTGSFPYPSDVLIFLGEIPCLMSFSWIDGFVDLEIQKVVTLKIIVVAYSMEFEA